MEEPIFLDVEAVLALYADIEEDYGVGVDSFDFGRLEGALGRVESFSYYGDPPPTVPQLAACLAYTLAKAHAFGDGNKRTSLAAMGLFLGTNGWRLEVEGIEDAIAVEQAVANEMAPEAFTQWVVDRAVPI